MKKLFALPLTILLASAAFTACDGGKDQKIKDQEKELEELRALAEMDRKEMENQYEQFALQYDELKKGIRDDSIIAKLEAEQKRAEELAEQLKKMRNQERADAAEIRRLKQELESVRAVLRSYIIQVDSLTRENGRLTNERDEARTMLSNANTQISSLNDERARLNDKVAIAAQLNASAIGLTAVKKNGKSAKKLKEVSRFDVGFSIQRNVTAATGERRIYVRLMSPSGGVLNPSGKFNYENKSLDYSATKTIEFTGEEQRVNLVVAASNEFLQAGKYSVHIFCDGHMIGSSGITIEK